MVRRSLVVLIAFFSSRPVVAQCVAYVFPPTTATSIGVRVGTGWSDAPPIASAIGLWTGGCTGMAGSDFPALIADADGAITVDVSRIDAPAPSEFGGCGRFAPRLGPQGQVEGGTIEIFTTDGQGNDCAWVFAHANLDNLIAHELGHVFGLANSRCSSHLMGPDWPSVGPNPDECAWVDTAWQMTNEGTGGGTNDPPLNQDCNDVPQSCSPLVLDLDGDGVLTSGADDPVVFDLYGDGIPERMTWTNASSEEAFLWLDLVPNHRVDDGRELFGVGTVLPDGSRAADGFAALRAYDEPRNGGDGDGVITYRDAVWPRLLLWVDRDHDGRSGLDEIQPIHRSGVLELYLDPVYDPVPDAQGNGHFLRGQYLRRIGAGEELFAMDDIWFQRLP